MKIFNRQIFQTGQVKKIRLVVILILIVAALAYVFTGRREPTLIMEIKSPAFENNGQIPADFTCSGKNINPELLISGVPEGTKNLMLIVDDPDASRGITFNHWFMWNILPDTKTIPENSIPSGAVQGKNDAGIYGYTGPCPPPGKSHHYRFKLFALGEAPGLSKDAGLGDLEKIAVAAIQKAELVGIYERKQ